MREFQNWLIIKQVPFFKLRKNHLYDNCLQNDQDFSRIPCAWSPKSKVKDEMSLPQKRCGGRYVLELQRRRVVLASTCDFALSHSVLLLRLAFTPPIGLSLHHYHFPLEALWNQTKTIIKKCQKTRKVVFHKFRLRKNKRHIVLCHSF